MRVQHQLLAAAAKRMAVWSAAGLGARAGRLEALEGGLQLAVRGPAGWLVEAVEGESTVEGQSTEPESWGLTVEPSAWAGLLAGLRGRDVLELGLRQQAGRELLSVEGEGVWLLDEKSGLLPLAEAGEVPVVEAEESWSFTTTAERLAGLLDAGVFGAADPEVNPARALLVLQAADEQMLVQATDGRVMVQARSVLAQPVDQPVSWVVAAAAAKRVAAVLGTLPALEAVEVAGLADGTVLLTAASGVNLLVPAQGRLEPPEFDRVVAQLQQRQVLASLQLSSRLRQDAALVVGLPGARVLGVRSVPGAVLLAARRDVEAAASEGLASVSLPAEVQHQGEAVLDGSALQRVFSLLAGQQVELAVTPRFLVVDQVSESPVVVRVVVVQQGV